MGYNATSLHFPLIPKKPELIGSLLTAIGSNAILSNELRTFPEQDEIAQLINDAMHMGLSYQFGGELTIGPGFSFDVIIQSVTPDQFIVTLTFEERLYDILEANEETRIRVVEWFVTIAIALETLGFALLYVRDDPYWIQRDFLLGIGLDGEVPFLIIGVQQAMLQIARRDCLGSVMNQYCILGFLAPYTDRSAEA